jgi:hypothetical protein
MGRVYTVLLVLSQNMCRYNVVAFSEAGKAPHGVQSFAVSARGVRALLALEKCNKFIGHPVPDRGSLWWYISFSWYGRVV